MPEIIVPSTKIRHQNSLSFFTPLTPCSNAQSSLRPFFFEIFLSPCLFILLLFSLFVVCSLLYLGTSIRWDIATSITGQGQYLLIVVVHARRYDYASFTMLPPRHSSFPLLSWFYDAVSVPSSCTSTTCLSLQHLPLLSCCLCLYPCMCIPYSISRCSLTLYGAHAGHCCCLCQSSFIRFAMLSYDDAPSHVIPACRKKVKSSEQNKAKFNAGHEVVRTVDTHCGMTGRGNKRKEICQTMKRLCVVRHDGEKLLLVDLAILVKVKLVYHRLSDDRQHHHQPAHPSKNK
jgi:hypothetical protein